MSLRQVREPENGPRVEIDPDFAVLERRLVALILETQSASPEGPLAPILVVAPTRRLLAHLQSTLAAMLPGLMGVRFRHYDGLAHDLAEAGGVDLPRLLGQGVKEALLERAAERAGDPLAAFIKERPRGVAALLATIEELREAAIAPEQAKALPGISAEARPLLRAYADYCASLSGLGRRGHADRAGRMAIALPSAGALARRAGYQRVIHYGAYELIGINADLMRAIGESIAPVVYLAPGHPTAPAYAYARRFWSEIAHLEPRLIGGDPLSESATPIEAPAPRRYGDRLRFLYDEESPALPALPVGSFHAQGARSELAEALLRILARFREGDTSPARVAIVARNLDPYAPHLRSLFEAHALPFHTSATRGAAREPIVLAVLWLLRCLADDFPAGPLFNLIRSGFLRAAVAPDNAHAWERLARDWQVSGGAAVWTEGLPRWVEASSASRPGDPEPGGVAIAPAQARGLAACVKELQAEAKQLFSARSWSGWRASVRELLARRIAGFAPGTAAAGSAEGSRDPGVALLLNALDDLQALDAAEVPFRPMAALAHLERSLEGAALPIGSIGADGSTQSGDNGGVRVLDAMQARGLQFDAVYLIGMNADLFHQRVREDPFLPDEDRRRLRSGLSRPLRIAAESHDEEHLLLAHLLGAATSEVTVSWLRADEDGKSKVAALALREVARIALGAADLHRVEEVAVRIGADPRQRALEAADRHRLLTPSEAGLAAALAARSPRTIAAVVDRLPAVDRALPRDAVLAGLRYLATIEDRRTAAETPFDALVGSGSPGVMTWSPSRLETFGRCPQQYFFREILQVEEWDDLAEPHAIEARHLGLAAHATLRDVYTALLEAGSTGEAAGGMDTARRLAEERLESAWRSATGRLAGRLRPQYPMLWALLTERWLAALRSFIRDDLEHLRTSGLRLASLEQEIEAALPLPGGRTLPMRGRLDRTARAPDGTVVVADYKTSGDLEALVNPKSLLNGSRLQVGLYLLMAEQHFQGGTAGGVRGEILGVGPEFAGTAGYGGVPDRAGLDASAFERVRAGFMETLGVLADLAGRGLFPFHETREMCHYCPYRRACRKDHLPTLERLAALPALRDYRLTLRKNTLRPTLIQAGDAGDEEEE